MSLRTKLTLLFLAAVQVTFLTAVAGFWAVQSWQNLTDDLTLIHQQNLRLDRAREDDTAAVGLAELRDHTQTLEEAELVTTLAGALRAPGDAERKAVREAVAALKGFYDAQVERLRERARFVRRLSTGLFVAIVVAVLTALMVYFGAIRVWLVRPIQRLSEATGVISTGDLTHRIPVTTRDELGRLGESINAMAGSLADIQTRLVTAERFAAVGEMAAYVAHNIRNPLASVRATAQSEIDDLDAHDPRRAALTDIVTATDQLAAWVVNLLRSASPVTLERSLEDVNGLVGRSVELARAQLAAKRVETALALDPGLPPVTLDRSKMEQVVSVVLSNAIEATPSETTIDVASTRLPGPAGGTQVAIRIADRGSGIPKERLAKLFTPFATTKKTGTGLGLSLAQRIVTAHQGALTVANRDEGGTIVEIRLPAEEETPQRVDRSHR